MKYFVTGGAGFIGSNLVERLLKNGHEVIAFDNFSTGFKEFTKNAMEFSSYELIIGDILNFEKLAQSIDGCDFVFHLAANADVRYGLSHPKKDLEQNTIGTFNVLEAMRLKNISNIAFSSTGSVYGECEIFPTPENAPFPIQTSLYAASKLAGEALISSYCEGFEIKSWIFRFVSILGERYTHGHVFDFYKSLTDNSEKLQVLGDGTQQKSYLYIQDCIDAMLLGIEKTSERVNIINLGYPDYIKLKDSVSTICKHLDVRPELVFSGGKRGWVGDNPFIFLDTQKLNTLGWRPDYDIEDGIIKTIEWLKENEWVYKTRK